MDRRPLGKTGLLLSAIGFGAFKIGRNEDIKYAQSYALPTDEQVRALLEGVLALGINYLDTAPAYGTSEQRLGAALGSRINDLIVSTKVGESFEHGQSRFDFSRSGIEASVERSLRRLQREVLDIVFLHAPADDLSVQIQTDAIAVLQQLRQAGKVRAIGLSAKTQSGCTFALDWADALMVEYHAAAPQLAPVMALAQQKNVGVVVKKGLASGKLPPEQAIPFVLRTSGVTSLALGSLSLAHVQGAVRIADLTAKSAAAAR